MSLSIGILQAPKGNSKQDILRVMQCTSSDADNRWFDNGLSYAGKQGCCALGAFSIAYFVPGKW